MQTHGDKPWLSWRRVRKEARAVLALALPAIVTNAATQAMVITDQIFVGHLGTKRLAAAAIGNTYFNIMWFFLLGMTSAMDTLGSQAFGAGDHQSLRVWLFTGLWSVSAWCIPAKVLLLLGEPAAKHVFHQPDDVAQLVGVFCSYLVPGVWPLMWSVMLMKYMQVQNLMRPPAMAALAAFVLNIAFNWLLIHFLGFRGAPLATSFARVAQFLLTLAALLWATRRKRAQGKQLAGLPVDPIALVKLASEANCSARSVPFVVEGIPADASTAGACSATDTAGQATTSAGAGAGPGAGAGAGGAEIAGQCTSHTAASQQGRSSMADQGNPMCAGIPAASWNEQQMSRTSSQSTSTDGNLATTPGWSAAGAPPSNMQLAAVDSCGSSNSKGQHAPAATQQTEVGAAAATAQSAALGAALTAKKNCEGGDSRPDATAALQFSGWPTAAGSVTKDGSAAVAKLPRNASLDVEGSRDSWQLSGGLLPGRLPLDWSVHGGSVQGRSMCGGSMHGGIMHGGSVHGGIMHGGSVHGGSVHGRSIIGGSVHGGMAYGGGVQGAGKQGLGEQATGWQEAAKDCLCMAVNWRLLWRFLRLGIPGGIMLALECSVFEGSTVLSGLLGEVQLAAHSVILNLSTFTFVSFPFAVAISATIRVGNLLGARRPKAAKLAAAIATALGVSVMTSVGIILLLLRKQIGHIFVKDPAVLAQIERIVPLCAAFQPLDGLQATTQGILRAMSKQAQVASYNLFSFWGVGFSTQYLLAFKAGLGIRGLWFGLMVGLATIGLLNCITILSTNWGREVDHAQAARVQQPQDPFADPFADDSDAEE